MIVWARDRRRHQAELQVETVSFCEQSKKKTKNTGDGRKKQTNYVSDD